MTQRTLVKLRLPVGHSFLCYSALSGFNSATCRCSVCLAYCVHMRNACAAVAVSTLLAAAVKNFTSCAHGQVLPGGRLLASADEAGGVAVHDLRALGAPDGGRALLWHARPGSGGITSLAAGLRPLSGAPFLVRCAPAASAPSPALAAALAHWLHAPYHGNWPVSGSA